MTLNKLTEVPVPKFAIGQEVWAAVVKHTPESYPCPDCLGQGTWGVSNAAGFEGRVECPRCRGNKVLQQQSRSGEVQKLTIGSVRINTAVDSSYDNHIQYMCDETGVGGGTLWNEQRLFSDQREAHAEAEVLGAAERADLDTGRQARERELFRTISTYQLKDAEVKAAESALWDAQHRLRRLLERIAELNESTYLMSSDEDFDREKGEEPLTGMSMPWDTKKVRLLQEHLMSYDKDNVRFLNQARAEAKECKC